MSKSRPALRPAVADPEPAAPLAARPIRAWVRFWFSPTDPVGLHGLRLLAGLLFLGYLLPLAGNIEALFGLDGWFDGRAYRETAGLERRANQRSDEESPDIQADREEGPLSARPPQPLSWSVLYLCGSNVILLTGVYWLAIAVLVLFTVGIGTPMTSILTWVIVASCTASPALSSDADGLMHILALYLMVGYVLLGLSNRDQPLWRRLLGSRETWLLGRRSGDMDVPERGSAAGNLATRLIQVHFALVMLPSGLHKLQFGDWWAGVALWYPLHPLMEMKPGSAGSPEQVRFSLTMLGLAAYALMAWQIAFPFFAWRRRWRAILVGGAVIGWLGSAFVYRVPAAGPALFICCLSYLSAAEWSRLRALLGAIPGLQRIASQPVSATKPLVSQAVR